MSFIVVLTMRDTVKHGIEVSSQDEALSLLELIAEGLEETDPVFKYYNDNDELTFVCNLQNLLYAHIEKKEN